MPHKSALKFIGSLWVASLLGAIAAFLIQVLLARELGPEDYGLFSSIIAVIALLTPLTGFGIPQYWLKVYGLEGHQANRWLPGSIQALWITVPTILLIILIWLVSLEGPFKNQLIVALFSLFLISQLMVELVSSKLQLEGKFQALALWQLTPHLLRLGVLIAIWLAMGASIQLESVSWAYALTSIPLILFGLYNLLTMLRNSVVLEGHDGNEHHASETRQPQALTVLQQSWPFGIAAFFQIIYYQSDIIMVKYISGEGAAGIYSVAFSIMAAVYLLPAVIYQKYFLPKFHRWANHDPERFYQTYILGNKAMAAIGLSAMLGLWLSAFWLVPFLFGIEYGPSVSVLNILALSTPLIFLAFNSGATLVTRNNMRRKVKYMGFVALINLALNLSLIPVYSETGAAIATVVSNCALFSIYFYSARKHVFNKGGVI